jgi:hypothetical protein
MFACLRVVPQLLPQLRFFSFALSHDCLPFVSPWATAESAPPFKPTRSFLRTRSSSRVRSQNELDSCVMHDIRHPLVASRAHAIRRHWMQSVISDLSTPSSPRYSCYDVAHP